uniref:Adhesion G protein-coupled receptor A1a n=1 Tax=Oryzias latipes TaxID=8090 RepID=A0A3P9JW88_ORYLA
MQSQKRIVFIHNLIIKIDLKIRLPGLRFFKPFMYRTFSILCNVGIVLHYASLSTMLWLTCMARNVFGDVSKDPFRAPDKNGPTQTRGKPTILRFYLVSDGIPLIIVGVTAGFDLENYGSRDGALYCWMAWKPSLGGFYAPVGLLVLVMCIYFLCTHIQLKRHPERKYELRVVSEEQQQLSVAEPNHHCHPDGGGASSESQPFSAGVSLLANEHSFKSQLRATAFTLLLFLATWALGALAVSLGHFLDMIFSCLYGAFCVTLGLFLLIQHCAKRDDVWNRWWGCCLQEHQHLASPSSAKQSLLSPHPLQGPYDKMTPPLQSPLPSNSGPCCVAVMSPMSPALPLDDSVPSPLPLPNSLPHPALPLQSCLTDRAKSRSFNCPRPCLQDYRSHMASLSMDGSIHSPHSAQHPQGFPLVSNSPHPDLQLPCLSPHLDKQQASLQRQTSCLSFPRNTLPRQSLQEDGLFGADATGNIRTGPWKNETTV